MTNTELANKLSSFRDEKKIHGKGALAVVIHISRHARENGLPLDADALITEGSGQVLGLGKGAVQHILKEHGVTQILAEEGGRTSRGSIGIMRAYVALLRGNRGGSRPAARLHGKLRRRNIVCRTSQSRRLATQTF